MAVNRLAVQFRLRLERAPERQLVAPSMYRQEPPLELLLCLVTCVSMEGAMLLVCLLVVL